MNKHTGNFCREFAVLQNQEAYATIGRNIERLGDRLGAKLDVLATDVAVLRGR